VIGEALVDLVPEGRSGRYRESPGGSPFNVAVGLARLGNRTSLMARFADDRFGRLLRGAAVQEGIDLSAAPRAAERATVATASVDRAGQVTYEFDLDGTADWAWSAAELRAVSPATQVLHFGSIAAWTPPGAERIAGSADQEALEMAAEVIRAGLTGLAIWWSEHPHVPRERIVTTAINAVWVGFERARRGEGWA